MAVNLADLRPRRRVPHVVIVALVVASCTVDVRADVSSTTTNSTSSTTTTAPTTTTSTTTAPATTTTTTTTTTTSTTTTTTTTTTSTTLAPPIDAAALGHTAAAFASLAEANAATSLSVWRDGDAVLQLAAGTDRAGAPVGVDTPMVVASVSKLLTALTVARLAEAGAVDVRGPVPWASMGLAPDPAWSDVTVRELLSHTSGMPVAQQSWLDDPGTCADPLAELLAHPPTAERGRWRYSNGNYCALGLLIEAVTGARYDVAARELVLDPAGVEGPRLTVDGALPNDGPYAGDIARFDRLGAAGAWLAGSDHVAAVLASVTDADRATLHWPGIFLDAYGWGHTGTVLGAKACAWVIEDGRTVVVAVVAGERPSTGGGVCDLVLPALGADLGLSGADGLPLGEPERSPP